MAFTRSEKSAMMGSYREMLDQCQAIFVLEYSKMDMKMIDKIHAQAREAGGELHVVKNTLFKLAAEELGYTISNDVNVGTSLVGFAFKDAAALAKAVMEIAKNEAFKIKGGYLDKAFLNEKSVKALSDLPPLPVMRAKLLGTIMAPASKLVRTINEPGRSLAAVVQAHVKAQEAA